MSLFMFELHLNHNNSKSCDSKNLRNFLDSTSCPYLKCNIDKGQAFCFNFHNTQCLSFHKMKIITVIYNC